MTITIYNVSGAPSPWRVTLGMTFKGIEYETKLLSASNKEHKSDAYLQINPRGTVPTLINGDVTLRHSIAALAWLDKVIPEKPLFGETLSDSARIWQHTMEVFDYLPLATSGVLSPLFFHNATEATPSLQSASEQLISELSGLDNILRDGPFLSGENPGAVDAVAFPHVRLIVRAMDTKSEIMSAIGLANFDGFSTRISNWIERIEGLPRVASTFPPHWKE